MGRGRIMDKSKSEIRNPKSERNPKAEIRMGRMRAGRFSDFGLRSDFGFRISDLLALLLLLTFVSTSIASNTNTTLLFSFFREPNGQAGLQLATSADGLKWTEIKAPNGKSFLEPAVGGKLMRDPCLRLAADGTFHMVWTTS